jgi:hypothetical protein
MPAGIRGPFEARAATTESTQKPESAVTANTDNPLSLTYQPASKRARRRKRAKVAAAGAALTTLLALALFALRRGGTTPSQTTTQAADPFVSPPRSDGETGGSGPQADGFWHLIFLALLLPQVTTP